MIKYKIKHKIVNCEKIESVTSHDLYPSPVTNCHTFSDPLPPLERDILYGRPPTVELDYTSLDNAEFGEY